MLKAFVAFVCLSVPSLAFAQSSYYYNPSTGNSIYSRQSGSSTYQSGYNYNTGTTWNGTYNSNGTSHGTDSNGNYWNYNSNTGSYYNSSGTVCYGKGAYRTCTK